MFLDPQTHKGIDPPVINLGVFLRFFQIDKTNRPEASGRNMDTVSKRALKSLFFMISEKLLVLRMRLKVGARMKGGKVVLLIVKCGGVAQEGVGLFPEKIKLGGCSKMGVGGGG